MTEVFITEWVATVVFGAIRVVGAWIFVLSAMRVLEIFWRWERGEGVVSGGGESVGGRVARYKLVCKRRWELSTRRIKGVEGAVGWI